MMRALASFAGIHRGEAIVVCGCGPSLNDLADPARFVTVGVNDVGRRLQPDYLLVSHRPHRFTADRFHYIRTSRAAFLFTHLPEYCVVHPNVVRFRQGGLGEADLSDAEALPHGCAPAYAAVCLALRLGAASIGLIGVDYTGGFCFSRPRAGGSPIGGRAAPPDLAAVDAQFQRLGQAAVARGVRIVNLSRESLLTAFEAMALEDFARLLPQRRATRRRHGAAVRAVAAPSTPSMTGRSAAGGVVSVVIVSHNEGGYLERTVDSLRVGLRRDDEIVIVDDRSTDGSTDHLEENGAGRTGRRPALRILRPAARLGVSRARNLGACCSRGEVLVFADAHVEPPPGWIPPLIEALADPGVGVLGPVISNMHDRTTKGWGLHFSGPSLRWRYLAPRGGSAPYPVPLLGGGFLVMRRDVFVSTGGFDEGMVRYGIEDAEMSLRLWLLGYQCLLVPALDVAHLFRRPDGFPEYQRDWETVLHNQLRMAVVHFKADRIRALIQCRADNAVLPAALARLMTSDAWARRQAIHAVRRYDDDWFFERFPISGESSQPVT